SLPAAANLKLNTPHFQITTMASLLRTFRPATRATTISIRTMASKTSRAPSDITGTGAPTAKGHTNAPAGGPGSEATIADAAENLMGSGSSSGAHTSH